MFFNKSISGPAVEGAVDLATPGVDSWSDQRIANFGLPGQRFQRRHTGPTTAMSRGKTLDCRQSHPQTSKGTRTERRGKDVDIRKLKRQIFQKKSDGTEKAVRVLDRGGEPDFAQDLTAVDNANATAFGTRVDRQNAHALL